MLRTIIAGLFLLMLAVLVSAEDNFYYAGGSQIQLRPIYDKLVIGIRGSGYSHFSEFAMKYPQLVDTVAPEIIGHEFYIFAVVGGTNIDSLIGVLNTDTSIIRAQYVFENEWGGREVFGDGIVIQKADNIDQNNYDSLLYHYSVIETGYNAAIESIRYLKVMKNSSLTVLEIANLLHRETGILFSHPRLLKRNYKRFYIPNDKLFPYQYNFNNTNIYRMDIIDSTIGKDIDACLAWEITQGNPAIKIAILDDGITDHPDFAPGVIIDTIDVIGDYIDPIIMDSNCVPCDSCGHGFGLAGLLIGTHNDIGIAGLVPQCKLIFIKINDKNGAFPYTDSALAAALVLAAQKGANIISNSWGCQMCGPTDEMTVALNNITDPRLMGFSCSVFFAAGNYGSGLIAYPARMPQVLAVGSTDSVDSRWDYSCFGVDLDVMATSGNIPHWTTIFPGRAASGSIMTTDYPGVNGYNTYLYEDPYLPLCNVYIDEPPLDSVGVDYFCSFGGTSAACPQVAGIAAMIMSRRPDLKDSNYTIYSIIEHSAEDQVGPDAGYTPDLPGWDQYYGWGRVNAFRALLAVSRGDANNDKTIDLLDVLYLISYKFQSGPPPVPDVLMGDANCDAVVSILDMFYLISYLNKGGPAPGLCFKYGA
jgi:subtilisin family serine protease